MRESKTGAAQGEPWDSARFWRAGGYEVVGLVQVSDCIGLQSQTYAARTGVSARALDREGRTDFVLVVVLLSFERKRNRIKNWNGRKTVQGEISLGECSP